MGKNKIEVLLSANTKGFTSSIDKATKGLKTFNKQIDSSQKAARELDRGLSSMVGKFSALFGGISLSLFTKSIWDAGVAMESFNNSFKAITGSSKLAGEEIDFVRQVANQLGLKFTSTIDAYKSLAAAAKGTAVEGETTRSVFLGISEASAVLGLTAEQSAGALLAVSQMISKGKVSAEELRGQLGERLPGAFQIAAKSMGITTAELDKMLSSGTLLAEDFLPAFAAALHERFGGAAQEASNNAIAALNRFNNSWFELEAGIAESGFIDIATGKINQLTAALSDPEVKARIIELSTKFFELAEAVLTFTTNHTLAIAKVVGSLVALSALSRTLYLVTGAWKGLNAAMLAMTGLQLAPWLMTMKGALSDTAIAAKGLNGTIGALAGVFLAWEVGFQIGSFLNRFDAVKQAGIAMAAGLTKGFLQVKKAWVSISGGNVAAVEEEIAQAEKIYSDMFADIQNKAQRSAAAQRQSHKQVAESAKQSANEQSQAQSSAIESMKAKYKEYADEIKKLQDQIAGREKSLYEELRNMARSGMSELGAWKDLNKQAKEYEQTAKAAAEAGEFDKAVEYADKAKDLYSQLNREVKDGDKVMISQAKALETAMAGVERTGKIAIDVLAEQQEAANKAMTALTEESGFQKLREGMTETEKKWLESWEDMKAKAINDIEAVEDRLSQIKDRDVTVWINEKVKRAVGGPIGYARGGRLAGYGGGDRIDALLEAGEFVIRKEAVRKYGSGLFHALNAMSLKGNETIRARFGGLIDSLTQRPIRLQNGGSVLPSGTSATFNLNMNFSGNVSHTSRQNATELARTVMTELEKIYQGHS